MSPRKARTSRYVCRRCGLPLYRQGPSFRHAVNAATRPLVCGEPPAPVLRITRPLRTGTWMTIYRPAGVITIDGVSYHQRWSPGRFDDSVGRTVPITRRGRPAGTGTVMSAVVDGDGAGVTVAIEITRSIEEAA